MKNVKIILVFLVTILLLGGLFIREFYNKEIVEENLDAMKFKEEYEKLNGVKSGKEEYPEVEISADNPVVYADYKEIEEIITSGTGAIYFGFPECPWCRNSVPQLISAAEEVGLDKIYYYISTII